MGFKITLAGDQGSGKSTVAQILRTSLSAEIFSTGSFARACATRMGMDIESFNRYSEAHPEIDYEIDGSLVKLNDDPRDLIVDSRMAWHFIRGGFNIFLFTDPREAAHRIFCAGRATENYQSEEAALIGVRARRDSEIRRYRDLYRVNIKDPENYALLVDTTFATPAQVAEAIVLSFRRWQEDPTYKARFICPARLRYPDDETDSEKIMAFQNQIERGEPLPPVPVRVVGTEYYVDDLPEVALAAAMYDLPHVPFVIVPGAPDPAAHYIRMEELGLC